MKNIIKLIFFTAPFLAIGCLPDSSGIDPPNDRLIYPVGLALIKEGSDSADRYLAVANSNFDLSYNSGTLTAVNLTEFYRILEQLNSNTLDSAYYKDKLDWFSKNSKEINIPTELLIDEKNTLLIGSFASDLDLTPSGKRVLLPVRGEKSIFVIDVKNDNSQNPVFECGQGDGRQCDIGHRVQSNDKYALPLEPYEVESLEYGNYTLGFATHIYSGGVSLFIVDENDVTRAELIGVANYVVESVSGIAVRPNLKNPMYSDIYVSGRLQPQLRLFILRVLSDSENGSLIYNSYFNTVDYIDVAGDSENAQNITDARGLAVSKSGEYAFIVVRSPDGLLKIDLNTGDLIDTLSFGYAAEPSVVALYEYAGDPKNDYDPATFAFALCFAKDQLYIAETDNLMQPHILNTGSGPHAINFDYSAQKAFVANFRESTISVYDIDPIKRHFSYATVKPLGSDIEAIVKIGKPRLPQGHN